MYCTFPTNSSVTCHTQFFLTPDLVFLESSEFLRFLKEFGHVFEELVKKVQYVGFKLNLLKTNHCVCMAPFELSFYTALRDILAMDHSAPSARVGSHVNPES